MAMKQDLHKEKPALSCGLLTCGDLARENRAILKWGPRVNFIGLLHFAQLQFIPSPLGAKEQLLQLALFLGEGGQQAGVELSEPQKKSSFKLCFFFTTRFREAIVNWWQVFQTRSCLQDVFICY